MPRTMHHAAARTSTNPRALRLDPMIHRIMVRTLPQIVWCRDSRNGGDGGHRRAATNLVIAGDEMRYGVRIYGRLGLTSPVP